MIPLLFSIAIVPSRCYWKYLNTNSIQYKICLRKTNDVVSNVLKKKGYWPDCIPLVRIYQSGRFDGFIDAGANIGACSLFMAAHNISTVAFEPNPQNQVLLNNSIQANPSFPIIMFPYGLGSEEGLYQLFMEKRNSGNSVVGKAIHADTISTGMVSIRRLDSFCERFTWTRILLKIDVQGFEEKLLRGSSSCLRSKIRAIKFEVASDWLFGQDSSPLNIFKLLTQHGFNITQDMEGKHLFSEAQFSQLRGVTDAYAWRLSPS